MQEIPKWIIKVIEMEKLECRNCKKKFEADNLMSISIQESSNPPHKDYLCIGLYCRTCKELIIFELKEMSLIDFAFETLDQETSNKIQKRSMVGEPSILDSSDDHKVKRRRKKSTGKKSKITLKEVDDVRKFLKPKDLPYAEFLIALGMLPEEIKKYNYKNRDIK